MVVSTRSTPSGLTDDGIFSLEGKVIECFHFHNPPIFLSFLGLYDFLFNGLPFHRERMLHYL